ncbi:flavodoxin [Nocardioides aurantiacus]|uniref:Flavodoxin-like domain-containing protein n=1 Tax=Nocardioides aurantiacus TaxID=86796 RepID=A0A3N2CSL5_9ACTN|nr:flavodoxin [Nocardioides aurantiacus]ROR90234.1 hypothetical protein EDD33_1069 [Nocardioides aurantiacus]
MDVSTGRDTRPSALVVYESHVESTETIARAVGRGLVLEGMGATVVAVGAAPPLRLVGLDLLVVGAPTHAFSLGRPRTRQDAVRQGAGSASSATGVRDWLTVAGATPCPHHRPLVAMFDTRVRSTERLPPSAASRGAHLLRHLGFSLVARPQGFVVEGPRGPLRREEVGHAVAWGRGLARACQGRLAAAPPPGPSSVAATTTTAARGWS